MSKMSLILVGPLVYHDEEGGVVILFANLLEKLSKLNIDYVVIDSNIKNYKNTFIGIFTILYKIIKLLRKKEHISLHGTANDFLFFAPFILIVSRFFKKSYSLRKFAGNFDEVYSSLGVFQQKILERVLKHSSANFFETNYLREYFLKFNENTFIFPNVRNKQTVKVTEEYNYNFVFIGFITREKGIKLLCEVSSLLPNKFTIDVYGRLSDDFQESDFNDCCINYKGRINHDNVITTLLKYDVLLLPSYREGYPGIVIEALSVGMPIIATNLQSISEMLTEKDSILIDVGSSMQLQVAIESINRMNYKVMSLAALENFKKFDSDIQTKLFLQKLFYTINNKK